MNIVSLRWIVVASASASIMMVAGAQVIYGILIPHLESELNTSRSLLSGVMSLYLLITGLGNLFAGRVADHYGPKRVILVGFLLMGVFTSIFSQVSSVVEVYLIYGVAIAFGSSCFGSTVLSKLVSSWFEEGRGLALSTYSIGFPIGQLITAPIAVYLILILGWRGMLLTLGLLALVYGFGVVGSAVKARRVYH